MKLPLLKLGTRGSPLAMAQAKIVADVLRAIHVGLQIDLVTIQTTGDAVQDRPLHEIGGKGVFTKEIELALLRGEIDLAVHSLKDLPVAMPLVDQSNLVIASIPPRDDPADVLVSPSARSIAQLPPGARVGTSSLRRRAQVLKKRPDVQIVPLRGNVDTRLSKLKGRDYDAIILAAAGINRLGAWDDSFMTRLDPADFVPAAGQGALAVQCRLDDGAARSLVETIDDDGARKCTLIERQVVQRLDGDCHSPIAAWATRHGGRFRLRAAVARRGGELPVVRVEVVGADDIAATAADELLKRGAKDLLAG